MANKDSNRSWLPVAGFAGYEVSNDGLVRSWRPERNCAPPPKEPRILRHGIDKNGYHKVVLYRDSEPHNRRVPTLVAEAWLGSRPDGMIVRHLDGINTNDAVANLRWGTSKENSADSKAHGTYVHGRKVNTVKLTESNVREILGSRASHTKLASKYGVTPGAIWHIRAGRTWKHVSRA